MRSLLRESDLVIRFVICATFACLWLAPLARAGALDWSVIGRKANRAFHQKDYSNARRHFLLALKAVNDQDPPNEAAFEYKLNIAECDRLMSKFDEAHQILSNLKQVVTDRDWLDPLFPVRYWRRVSAYEESNGNFVAAATAVRKALDRLERVFHGDYIACKLCQREVDRLVFRAEQQVAEEIESGKFDSAMIDLADLFRIDSKRATLLPIWRHWFERMIETEDDRSISRGMASLNKVENYPPELALQSAALSHLLAARVFHSQGKHEQASVEASAASTLLLSGKIRGPLTMEARDKYAWYCFEKAAVKFRKGDYSIPVTQCLEEANRIGPLPSESTNEKKRLELHSRCMLYTVNLSRAYNVGKRLDESIKVMDSISEAQIAKEDEGFFPRYIRVNMQIAYQQVLKGDELAGLARFQRAFNYTDKISNLLLRNQLRKVLIDLKQTALTLQHSSGAKSGGGNFGTH